MVNQNLISFFGIQKINFLSNTCLRSWLFFSVHSPTLCQKLDDCDHSDLHLGTQLYSIDLSIYFWMITTFFFHGSAYDLKSGLLMHIEVLLFFRMSSAIFCLFCFLMIFFQSKQYGTGIFYIDIYFKIKNKFMLCLHSFHHSLSATFPYLFHYSFPHIFIYISLPLLSLLQLVCVCLYMCVLKQIQHILLCICIPKPTMLKSLFCSAT